MTQKETVILAKLMLNLLSNQCIAHDRQIRQVRSRAFKRPDICVQLETHDLIIEISSAPETTFAPENGPLYAPGFSSTSLQKEIQMWEKKIPSSAKNEPPPVSSSVLYAPVASAWMVMIALFLVTTKHHECHPHFQICAEAETTHSEAQPANSRNMMIPKTFCALLLMAILSTITTADTAADQSVRGLREAANPHKCKATTGGLLCANVGVLCIAKTKKADCETCLGLISASVLADCGGCCPKN